MGLNKKFINNGEIRKEGFTLIELLVVIAIIGILASTVMVSINSARIKSRDARRLTDMRQIQTALELYYNTYNRYPDSDYGGCGSWDCSGDGNGFLHTLATAGFLPADIIDPVTNNSCGNYCYYRYPSGYAGCQGVFYVLGVRDMETSANPHPGSPGWSCPSRNWQAEFEWVIGKIE